MRHISATSVALYLMAVLFGAILTVATSDRLIERFLAAPLSRQVVGVVLLFAAGGICYLGVQIILRGIEMFRRAIRGR